MIKVLLVVCNNVIHGTERYVLDLARNLDTRKFKVMVATPSAGPISETLKANNIEEIVYENGRMNRFTLKGTCNLFKKLRQGNFDIIHTNAGIIPNIIGKILRIKRNIESKHGILLPDEILEKMPLKTFLHEKIKEYFVDTFIVESDIDKEKMIKYFKIKSDKIKVIYNGIDITNKSLLSVTESDKVNNQKDGFLIGTIGRLTYQKGQDVLLKAFAIVCKSIKNVKLVILGSGEEESNLKKLVQDGGIEDKVIFENYREDFYGFIKGLDIFVLTSRFEGVPYVILEAMALGTPIISTKVGGIENVLRNNITALLIDKDNIQQIQNAIITLYNNPSLRLSLSNEAVNEIRKYSLKNMIDKVDGLYSGQL